MHYDRVHELELRHELDPSAISPTEHDPHAAADAALTRHIAQIVERHYPGHPWFIEVSHRQGIIKINLPALMKQNYFVVHIRQTWTDPALTYIKRGCGEILERFRLPRAGYSHDEYLSALHARPLWRFRNDNAVPE